jgi:hypothetical protein
MNGACGDGFGWGGNGAWWLLVLFLFAFNGNGGWGGNFGGNGAMPSIMNNTTNNDVQRGFDQQAVMGGLNGLTTAVSNGFANAEVSRCNAQPNLLQTLNANQAAANASMNSLAMGLQNCCCENRAGLADLKYTIATGACADRQAVTDALRDLTATQTAQTQAILDKMCQQEIDALKTQNANLQTQINLANLTQSQTAQTAKILADNAAQTQALEQYLNPAPIPAYMVQNPNCCGQVAYPSCGCNA